MKKKILVLLCVVAMLIGVYVVANMCLFKKLTLSIVIDDAQSTVVKLLFSNGFYMEKGFTGRVESSSFLFKIAPPYKMKIISKDNYQLILLEVNDALALHYAAQAQYPEFYSTRPITVQFRRETIENVDPSSISRLMDAIIHFTN